MYSAKSAHFIEVEAKLCLVPVDDGAGKHAVCQQAAVADQPLARSIGDGLTGALFCLTCKPLNAARQLRLLLSRPEK
jgi:hypothetical protein